MRRGGFRVGYSRAPTGPILGSRFCPYHHLIICETRTQRPKLESFIADSEMALYLYIFLTKTEWICQTRTPNGFSTRARSLTSVRPRGGRLPPRRSKIKAETRREHYSKVSVCYKAPVARVTVSAGRLVNVSRNGDNWGCRKHTQLDTLWENGNV